ncbi:MAG: hypothetical protein DA330_03035 [Nitrososphaera sp.]|nr:hypothetical protein [Nitrososphaera sp.]
MNEPMGTFIIDFQTTDFASDGEVAKKMLSDMQRLCEMENSYALDDPMDRAGWSFAKMFLAGQFVEKLYAQHQYEVDRTKGKKFEDKFIGWLAQELKRKGCGAQIKAAPEMKEI